MEYHKDDRVTLYGAGGHCKVVIDILKTSGLGIEKILDDCPVGDTFMSYPLSVPVDSVNSAIITIGNCNIRKRISKKLKVKNYITLTHPSAVVSPESTVGEGTVIMHGAIVQSSSSIGKHCILNTRSCVEHDSIIHDFVHIASGATVCGGVEIGECTWLGAGSVVKQGIKIGSNCMIGAGSVVVKDIPDDVVAYGNPCRVIRKNE